MPFLSWRCFGRDLRSIVTGALGIKPRGGVAHDELTLVRFTGRLKLEWHARETHPWDRDQTASMRAKLFLQQALEDTDAAIVNLFEALPPEIEMIEIRVLDPIDHDKVILAGSVHRDELDSATRCQSQSLRMRLKNLGIRYSSIKGERVQGLTIIEADVASCA